MTIESYLQGKFEFEFSALNFQSVFAGRGIEIWHCQICI